MLNIILYIAIIANLICIYLNIQQVKKLKQQQKFMEICLKEQERATPRYIPPELQPVMDFNNITDFKEKYNEHRILKGGTRL